MRVATVVLLASVAGSFLGTARAADEFEERVLDDAGAPAPSDARPAADSAQVERMQAMGICEQTVAERLENSSAAHWPDRSQYRVSKQGSGQFAIDGYVDVQGALGDVRTPWSCRAIRGYGDQWQGVASLGDSSPTNPPASTTESSPPTARVRPAAPPVESAPAAVAAPSASTGRESWSEVGSCRRLRIRDAYAEKYPDRRIQIVKGVVEYSGTQPIRNVRVCASGTCTQVKGAYPPLQSGATEPFTIQVPSLETVTVTAECSMLNQTDGP
jgi:hypothetical protein